MESFGLLNEHLQIDYQVETSINGIDNKMEYI